MYLVSAVLDLAQLGCFLVFVFNVKKFKKSVSLIITKPLRLYLVPSVLRSLCLKGLDNSFIPSEKLCASLRTCLTVPSNKASVG